MITDLHAICTMQDSKDSDAFRFVKVVLPHNAKSVYNGDSNKHGPYFCCRFSYLMMIDQKK